MCLSLSLVLLCPYRYHQFCYVYIIITKSGVLITIKFYYVSTIITNFTTCPSLSPIFYVPVITNSAMLLSLSSISRHNSHPLIEEARIRSYTNSCGVFGGQSDTGSGRPPNTSVSTSQYNFTKAPYSYFIIYHRHCGNTRRRSWLVHSQ